VVDGETDFVVDFRGEIVRVRAKIREVEVCGKIIYEVLLRTTDEERMRNLKKCLKISVIPFLLLLLGSCTT